MNTQEKQQVEIVKQHLTTNSRPHNNDINADYVYRISCGRVMLSAWTSKHTGRQWRSIDWHDGKVVNAKSWAINDESPTPIDKLAEELRDAL